MPDNKYSQQEWSDLIGKFINNTCTREEFDRMLAIVDEHSGKEALSEILRNHWQQLKFETNGPRVAWDEKFDIMLAEAKSKDRIVPVKQYKKIFRIRAWTAAAAILLLVSSAAYWFFGPTRTNEIAGTTADSAERRNDVPPGRNAATLTLADGTVIVLDSAQNGPLTSQGNVKVVKINSGLLSFNTAGARTGKMVYNTIATPRGGEYQIELSDGTKVWLNAASSLKFPAAFTGNERNVVLTGEAYFEVAKNAKKLFNVTANGMRVDVLGTHFNVNAYSDENVIATTLLEGSVKVTNQVIAGTPSRSLIMKQGQQANVTDAGRMSLVKDADVEKAVAWKNGQFQFDNEDIATIMRQISRWYDVDVLYQGAVPKRFFTGKISRRSNASQVIDMLEFAGVNLKLVGRNIVVVP